MEILGVGVPELAFIVLIALILLGPKDMIAAGRTIGRILRQFLTSPTWLAMRRTGEELQQLPTKLAREAGLEDLQNEMKGLTNQIKPVDMNKFFDERKIFDPASPTTTSIPTPPTITPDTKASPDTQAETPATNDLPDTSSKNPNSSES